MINSGNYIYDYDNTFFGKDFWSDALHRCRLFWSSGISQVYHLNICIKIKVRCYSCINDATNLHEVYSLTYANPFLHIMITWLPHVVAVRWQKDINGSKANEVPISSHRYIGRLDDTQTALKPSRNRKKLNFSFMMILGLAKVI